MNKKIKNIKIISPIYGLGFILNNVKLNNEIKIRFVDYKRKENKLLQQSKFNQNQKEYYCVLDLDYRYDPKKANEPYPTVRFLLDKIQTALRVFHPGIIGFAGIISKPKVSPFPLLIDQSWASSYKIDKNKLGNFPEFYKKFKDAYPKKQIAFDHFNKSCSEEPVIKVATNKIIDYCICLENLFVPIGFHQKSSYIISGLTILKFSNPDRRVVDILYQYRNALVHADYSKQDKLAKKYHVHHEHFYENCEKVIRKILQIYVEKQW